MSPSPCLSDAATPLAEWVAELLGTRRVGSLAASASTAEAPGVGVRTASPESPFDVLPSDDVLDKLCVLLIDLDSIVEECVRVLRDCAAASLPPSSASQPPSSVASQVTAAALPHRVQISATTFFSATRRLAQPNAPERLLGESTPSDVPRVPSLVSVLHLFLGALCTALRERKSQAELILGDCANSLSQLNALHRADPVSVSTPQSCVAADAATSGPGSLMTPSAVAGPEEVALWLQVHQAVVAFMWDRGADVLAATSLYVTAGSGWRGVMARYVHYITKDAKTLAQQAHPVPCSTDPRAVFAPVGADAVVSLWSAWCAAEVRQRFTRDAALSEDAAAAGLTRCLHLRHGPCVARRLGLQTCAHFPVLYALLAVYDACHVPGAAGGHAAGDAVGEGDASALRQSLVACATDLVNRHAGVLHVELVAAWLAAMRAQSTAASMSRGVDAGDTAGAGESGATADLATALWVAQAAMAEVTAESHLTGAVPLSAVWVGLSWKNTGPPRLWPALTQLPAIAAPPASSSPSSSATRSRAEGEAAAGATALPAACATPALTALGDALARCPVSPSRLQSLCLALLPLRWCIASAVHGVFGARAALESCDDVDDAVAVAARISAALSLVEPVDYALADPHLGVADVAAALLELRQRLAAAEEAPGQDGHLDVHVAGERAADDAARAGAAGSPARWFRPCLTRAAVDDLRRHVRPTAQLGVVAAAALWRARLWMCGEAVVFAVYYLRYLDSCASNDSDVAAAPAAPTTVPAAGGVHGEAGAGALVAIYGVSAEQVEEWWHAVACVTAVHALTSSVSQAAQVSATLVGGKAMPPRGLATLFAGCLPEAQSGTADRLALLSFLRRHHLLRRGGAVAGADDNVPSSWAPLPATALLPLMQALACPVTLRDEVVHVHRIFAALAPLTDVESSAS